ncbi:tyrosine-type recombinase/integrase [bacterium]|nr:tyrosine-type recombinase/integrase [bacterium]
MIKFAAWTGWRRSETLSLTWGNVDFERGEVRIVPGTSKNDAPRVILMTKAMHKLLLDQQKKVKQSKHPSCIWVFHRNGQQIKDFRRWWYYALEKCNLEGRTFHGFRRTAVMAFDRAGISDRVAMALTGHKTRRVWDNYRQVPRTDLEEAITKLEVSTKLTESKRKGRGKKYF